MNAIIEKIPDKISNTEVLDLLRSGKVDSEYIRVFKEFTKMTDHVLAQWLHITAKTFRSYKTPGIELKENLKEQIVLLLSLYKHGLEVFGSIENFNKWLDKENFYLDAAKPIDFVNTVTGIRFLDDRLTAMEFGDNV